MGLWSRIKGIFSNSSNWIGADDRWYPPFYGPETNAGARVDENSALTIPAVWACIRIIAESIGSLPLHLYTRQNKGKSKAINHPLYLLLHDRPNPDMSAMSFRETLAAHVLGWGNAYASIERSQLDNRVTALWPIGPDMVKPMIDIDTREIFYKVRIPNSGQEIEITKQDMLHIPGLGYNGYVGYSPIAKMREAIGLSLATEEFGARFFGSGTHPGLIVSHPGKLGETAHKNLRESLSSKYSGLGKAHRLLLLEEAMKVEKIGINPEEAQFLQTRKFQLSEIARIYRVPLHMLGEVDKGASYASIEQMSLDFVIHTLRPWLVRFEQSYNNQLFLTELERKRYFWEHLVDGLLRGDLASRYEAYTKARNWGWLSADDIRELENMNPLPDGKGEIYLQPLNMVEAGAPPPPPPAPKPKKVPPPDQMPMNPDEMVGDYWKQQVNDTQIIEPYKGIFIDAIEQILSREANQLKREPNLFEKPFENNDIPKFIEKKMTPVIELFIMNNNGRFDKDFAKREIIAFTQYHLEKVKQLLMVCSVEKLSLNASDMAEESMIALLKRVRNQNHALS